MGLMQDIHKVFVEGRESRKEAERLERFAGFTSSTQYEMLQQYRRRKKTKQIFMTIGFLLMLVIIAAAGLGLKGVMNFITAAGVVWVMYSVAKGFMRANR